MRRILGDYEQTRPSSLDPFIIGASRRVPFRIVNVPSGITVVGVQWSAKVLLTDADAARKINKNVTTTLVVGVGYLSQPNGGSAIEGYFDVAATEITAALPAVLYYDVWIQTSDGGKRQVARGDLSVVTAVTLALGGGGANPDLPPAQQGSLAWAFDPSYGSAGQAHASRVGPTAQLGSTAGSDSNDPTLAASPARYVFGDDDWLDFGDSLDTELWTQATGWTLMVALHYVAANDFGFRSVLPKFETTPLQLWILLDAGKPKCVVYDNTDGSNEIALADAALTDGRHVLTARYDRAQARGSRITLFVDGAPIAQTPSVSGTAGAIPDSTSALRVGLSTNGGVAPIGIVANIYGWVGGHVNGDVATNDTWLRTTRGWS